MDQQTSLNLTGEIASLIAEESPYIPYTDEHLALSRYPERYLRLCGGDRELLFVVTNFLRYADILSRADDDYVCAVLRNAKKYTPQDFALDPFLQAVHFDEERQGNILLTTATYRKGEFFQYDMPDLNADLIVPKLGFCTGEVSFPTVYEGRMPWMSACPSEINSMQRQMSEAHGNVLTLGLGLGYFPFIVSGKPNVEHVTIVEIEPRIIALFEKHVLPCFPHPEKITIVQGDAVAFLEGCRDGQFDYCFADIWEGQEDGAKWYKLIRPHERRMPHTQFSYWIQEQIEWYLTHQP